MLWIIKNATEDYTQGMDAWPTIEQTEDQNSWLNYACDL